MLDSSLPETLSKLANQLRIESIQATTAAGSGHPTSCASAADLVAAIFFRKMKFFPRTPHAPENDRFIFSKGHAAPLLYAAWAELGHFPISDLHSLRKLNSPLEGHPTPRLDFVDIATGSLGQGLATGLGMAIQAQISELPFQTYVLMGDGEMAEGSVWEAASLAAVRKLSHLTVIVDVNRLGQSQETAFGHQLNVYQSRFEAFGWRAISIDGHSMSQILAALDRVGQDDRPLAIIAKTIKGKGILGTEDLLGWHGKPLPPDMAERAIAHLRPQAISFLHSGLRTISPSQNRQTSVSIQVPADKPSYKSDASIATRKAVGNALVRLGGAHAQMVVLDGDVENSTYTDSFGAQFPDRFIECFIAEQTMVGAASGLAALGSVPFVSTFAAFFSRAYDQIRMAAGVSQLNIKLVGTHAGCSIGEDGASQMGLEDIALMRSVAGSVVLSPSDAYCAERLIEEMLDHKGFCYMRTARPATPLLYGPNDTFEIGGARILRQSASDVATVIATGVTVYEALSAADTLAKDGLEICVVDAYSIKPLAEDLILDSARKTRLQVITVEDHYVEGGLGDTVAGQLSAKGLQVHKLAVRELPHSGLEKELLAKYKIDAQAIITAVRDQIESKLSAA